MAHLPPRKFSTTNKSCKQNSTPLQILLQMGFPKHRALKALAATGNRSVQLASDWLLTHVRDASLDADCPREYILYACPTGPLLAQLHKFWIDSMKLGWNGAHNFPPHITLVSFFKAPDEYSLQLEKFLKQVIENIGEIDGLKLEPYISQNFMGLFVCEEHADYLRRIALQYVKKVSNATICLEPHVKSLHITLAYQFPVTNFPALKDLVEEMTPLAECSWELRLYSRDSRFPNHQVHKVIQEYEPKENDELELVIGDYIYIDGEHLKNSTDGWVHGTSWLTGVTGLLPAVYTERTAESDSWTLHKSMPLIIHKNEDATSEPTTAAKEEDPGPHEEIGLQRSEECFAEWDQKYRALFNNTHKPELENPDSSQDVAAESSEKTSEKDTSNDRWLFSMRHGERVDFTYGSWVPHCFDCEGKYTRKDLNMPVELPIRNGGHIDYVLDGPLTRVGELQAFLVGEALRLASIPIHRVYCSPAFRCIGTAHHLLRGLECADTVTINIEPGLFEFKVWYKNGLPKFMSSAELIAAGYNINADYKPFTEWSEDQETIGDFFIRSKKAIEGIYSDTQANENIILVGHGCTLDVTNKCLNPSSSPYEIHKMIGRVPYCAVSAMRGGTLVPPPIPPHINTSSPRFRWQTLLEG